MEQEKISALIGASEHGSGNAGRKKAAARKDLDDDDAEEEDVESSDSELPEDWMERYNIQEQKRRGCVVRVCMSVFMLCC